MTAATDNNSQPRPVSASTDPGMAWVLALVAAGLVYLSFAQAWWNPIQDPDLFWQIWAGRQILAGDYPDANGFSWTAPRTPWTPHAPLVAVAYAVVGLENAGLLRGVIVSLTAVLLTALAWRRENAWATLFALCWCICLVIYGRTERALTWGNLLLAIITLLLYRVEWRLRWRLPVAVLLVALWANVHGSFIIGVLMLGLVRWYWGVIALFACMANPSGPWLYALLFGYGAGTEAQAFVHQAIPEWYALDLTQPMSWVRLVCLLLAAGLLAKDRNWRALILCVCVGALAVRHQRFFDVLGIALLPTMAASLARYLPRRPLRHPAPVLAGALLATAFIAPRPTVDTGMYPTPLVAQLPRDARLFNAFHLGGWLGYHGATCFWDPRNDCYPLNVLRDGLKIEKRWPGWETAAARWEIDAVLTADAEMQAALREQGWHEHARFDDFSLLRSMPRQASVASR